jgi:hypothetical protein
VAPDLLRCARRRQAEASGGVAATPRLEAALGVQPVRDGDLLGARGLVGPRREVVTVDAQPGAVVELQTAVVAVAGVDAPPAAGLALGDPVPHGGPGQVDAGARGRTRGRGRRRTGLGELEGLAGLGTDDPVDHQPLGALVLRDRRERLGAEAPVDREPGAQSVQTPLEGLVLPVVRVALAQGDRQVGLGRGGHRGRCYRRSGGGCGRRDGRGLRRGGVRRDRGAGGHEASGNADGRGDPGAGQAGLAEDTGQLGEHAERLGGSVAPGNGLKSHGLPLAPTR